VRILLVEDDLQLGAALHRALELEGFGSTWVRRLQDARTRLVQRATDLIVLDVNLPDGEGFTLLDELRRGDSAPPVVVITAREALSDRLRGLNLGADDYLVKPFAVPELMARIRAVLRRVVGANAALGVYGSLEVDEARRRVTVAGELIVLTPIEFRVLIELTRRPGAVVARGALIQRVWSGADEGTDSALDYHVHGLRRKIGADRIVTERGIGFRLVTE
jgi:DNA-binding response OmpR family regulator